MAFGNSKLLSGFIPDLFDEDLRTAGIKSVESFNFGLPGDTRFVDDLEAMIARGTEPDILLLTFPWPATESPRPHFFNFIDNDQEIIDRLFPFRKLPRNFCIMLAETRFRPSVFRSHYVESGQTLVKVEKDRGYYFIVRQSHYMNNELPPEFKAPSDTPLFIPRRTVPDGPIYRRLVSLLNEHHITCLFIPTYFREGQFAPYTGTNSDTEILFDGNPGLGILGPDYYLYPNRLFSDSAHANRLGAEAYTHAIAQLVRQWLKDNPLICQQK